MLADDMEPWLLESPGPGEGADPLPCLPPDLLLLLPDSVSEMAVSTGMSLRSNLHSKGSRCLTYCFLRV